MEERWKPIATSTDALIYLIDLRSNERLAIQFLPEELNINRNVNLQNVQAVGRNNPLHHFTGGSKEISFTFYLLADDDAKTDAAYRAKWIESLTYQDTTTGKTPQVVLIWGRRFRNNKWVVSKFSAKEKIHLPGFDFLPQMIEISITLTLDNDVNERVNDIKDNLGW
ncbi:MAG: hypothetical protein MUC49_15615 [Raineya sp.]|jgi:hypothetical protein|nr:hypothetical protein [Raineya sp.]